MKSMTWANRSGYLDLVAVEAAHQVLAGMPHDLAGHRQAAQHVERARIELERTLVFQLADDVFPHQLERGLGIDEVVVEDFLERHQRVVSLLFEDAVAVARQILAEVRRPFLPKLPDAGTLHLLVVRDHLAAALHLAGDAFRFVHEEHHDVENRLLEMHGVRRVGELAAQRVHFLVQHLEALDLHLRAREAIEDRPVLQLGLEQLAQQDGHHLAVAHHAALAP